MSTKSPYTHGLEKIYALETIDASTVRPMNRSSVEEKKPSLSFVSHCTQEKDPPLTLDLTDRYRGWIYPLVWSEPIEVLQLCSQAKKAAIEAGATSLFDIKDWRQNPPSGLGAGHVDEILHRLQEHLKQTPVMWESFDPFSLIRIALAKKPILLSYALLTPYGLQDLFPLSRAQQMELRRQEEKEYRAEPTITEKERMEKVCRELIAVFCLSWMEQRGGIASTTELMECLEITCFRSKYLYPCIQMIEDHFLQKPFFSVCCQQVQKDLWAADEIFCRKYCFIEELALSYFYQKDVVYSQKELIDWIIQEGCSNWQKLDPLQLERVLELSPFFLLYRAQDGSQQVQLHPEWV